MKICDKCHASTGEMHVASDELVVASTDERHHLCPVCIDAVREFIRGEVKDPGKPMHNQQRAKH